MTENLNGDSPDTLRQSGGSLPLSGTGHRLVRFGIVGLAATALYALVAFALTHVLPSSAALASLIAFGISGIFSYCGHRMFTFQASGGHARSASRFAGVNILAYAVAAIIPWIVSDILGYRPVLGFALVCIFIPAMNFVLLNIFVFNEPAAKPSAM